MEYELTQKKETSPELLTRLMSPSSMLSYNLSLILKIIKMYGPISRADISRKLGSSKSTISSGIKTLEEMGLVNNVGSGNPKTGRKSILLAFNPQAYFFIAADMRWKKVNLAIVDMSGEIHEELTYHREETDPDIVIAKFIHKIKSIMDFSPIPNDRIEAVGIMIPGIVDTDAGIVKYSSTLGWENEVDIVSKVRSVIKKQITILNDANALTLGEMWLGSGKSYNQFAFIYTEGGMGGAYVLDGKIVLGIDAAAGEFGKILITGNQKSERAESRLCLKSILAQYSKEDTSNLAYEEIVGKVLRLIANDKLQNSTLLMIDQILNDMAQVIVNIIAICNPEAFILNCSYMPEPDKFLTLLTKKVYSYLPEKPKRTVKLLNSSLNDKDEVLGAAAAAISRSRFDFVLNNNNGIIKQNIIINKRENLTNN